MKRRTGLKKMGTDNRHTFTGTFIRMGKRHAFKGEPLRTILLQEVRDKDGMIVSDHLWFNYTAGFRRLGELSPGDVIQFDGRVQEYERGYFGHRDDVYVPTSIDYKISYPTKISRIKEE